MANGLITKQTDLTSLKYGSMPLGSDAPYVTKNIGQASGGLLGSEISHRIDDASRIAKMLIDKPGLKYILHEAELQQIGVEQRIKKARANGKSAVGAVLGELGHTVVGTAKILGSTLAQVPVNGTGLHFLKGFRTDTYLQDGGNHSAFAAFFGAGGVEGAQYALQGNPVPGTHETELLGKYSQYDYDEYLNVATGSGEARLGAENGVPIKVAPSGSTIRDTTKAPGYQGSIGNQLSQIPTGSFVSKTGIASVQSGQSETFNEELQVNSTYLVQKQNYLTKNNNVTKEARIRLGDQGAPSTQQKQDARSTNSYWFMSDANPMVAAEVDKINMLFPNDGKVDGEKDGRDLVKFRFHIVTPDGKEKVLYFRAFIDSFADNYSGQWNPVKYLGRAEDFQIYGGFQRKISLSFKIAAATRSEMRPIYEKMIWLASATAPTYANDGQFMRGTITKITLGDYIYELPGILNSVNYTWNTEYPWEIAMTEPEKLGVDDFEQELPMVMDCSIDFTPIHTFTPTTGLKQYITTKITEKGRKGIPDIDNQKTGIEPTPNTAKA